MAGLEKGEPAPTKLGALLAGADRALGPVEERVGLEPLAGDVDPLVAVLTLANHRPHEPGRVGEAAVGLVRPLHRRADGLPLGQTQVVTHADLFAVADHGCSGQGEHQAVHQLQAPAVSLEHG